jgi:hypothetical protein
MNVVLLRRGIVRTNDTQHPRLPRMYLFALGYKPFVATIAAS